VLDHFILSRTLMDTAFVSGTAIHDGDNLSDHDPIIMTLKLDNKFVRFCRKYKEIRLVGNG
jgi:hypothetical protein